MESKQRAWESLRNDARHIDSLIEHQLTALENTARIGDNSNGPGFGTSSSNTNTYSHSNNNTNAFNTNIHSHINNTNTNTNINTNNNNNNNNTSTMNSGSSASDGPATIAKLEQTQREFDRQRAEVEAALLRFESIVDNMADTARGLPPTSAVHTHTDRFQRLVAEKRRAVQRVVADFRRRREWAELMPAVAGTIAGNNNNNNMNMNMNGEMHDGVRLLVEEQSALRHTQRRVMQIVQQAEATREGLRGQRERFMRMEDRVLQIAERVPMIKSVLGRIDSRRRREAVVLGAIIGVCLFITVFFI